MSKLTRRQELAAAVAAEVSRKAFSKAQRTLRDPSLRAAAYAAQAEQYLAAVDAAGIDRSHPTVAWIVRRANGNIATHARLVAAAAAPVATPAGEADAAA